MILLHKPAFHRKLLIEIELLRDNIEASKDGIYIQRLDLLTNSAIQSVLYDRKEDKVSSSIIRPILIEACLLAETSAAGAGEMCLRYLVKLLPEILKRLESDDFSIDDELDHIFKKIISQIKKSGKRPCSQSVKNHINDFDISDNFKIIISKALEIAGKSGKITLEKGVQEETKIIVRNGCSFNLIVDSIFLGKANKWQKRLVNCLVVDGIILDVSEIHHILEKAAESKEPFIIFAREFSPEVLQTITLNFLRGTIHVVPVKVALHEDSLNLLVDIAIVCGTDVISSQKGETISAAVSRGISQVKKVTCRPNSILIENPATKKRQENHIKNIKSQMSDLETQNIDFNIIETKRKLLNNRITALFSESVIVSIGKSHTSKQKNIIEKLDVAFREIKTHSQIGYVHFNDLFLAQKDKNFISISIENILEDMKRDILSIPTAIFSIKNAHSAIKSICSIERVLFYN